MSFAACNPSSFKFFSICFDRARAALSSADMAQPIFALIDVANGTVVVNYVNLIAQQV